MLLSVNTPPSPPPPPPFPPLHTQTHNTHTPSIKDQSGRVFFRVTELIFNRIDINTNSNLRSHPPYNYGIYLDLRVLFYFLYLITLQNKLYAKDYDGFLTPSSVSLWSRQLRRILSEFGDEKFVSDNYGGQN